ncbi:MAG: hypothetical protein QXV60_00705 [Nitrososphaerota archaeon]
MESLADKMPGINVTDPTLTINIPLVDSNLYNLLQRESYETFTDYEIRKRLTIIISNLVELNTITAMILAHMIIKKLKYNVHYGSDIEFAINYILQELQKGS